MLKSEDNFAFCVVGPTGKLLVKREPVKAQFLDRVITATSCNPPKKNKYHREFCLHKGRKHDSACLSAALPFIPRMGELILAELAYIGNSHCLTQFKRKKNTHHTAIRKLYNKVISHRRARFERVFARLHETVAAKPRVCCARCAYFVRGGAVHTGLAAQAKPVSHVCTSHHIHYWRTVDTLGTKVGTGKACRGT